MRHRSRGIALLLVVLPLLVGLPLGLHYFYLGYTGRGVLTLGLLALAFVLGAIGLIGVLNGLFVGVGGGALVALILSLVIVTGLLLQQLIDIVRIAINDLKPKNGEYNPRFFQTHPAAEPAPPSR